MRGLAVGFALRPVGNSGSRWRCVLRGFCSDGIVDRSSNFEVRFSRRLSIYFLFGGVVSAVGWLLFRSVRWRSSDSFGSLRSFCGLFFLKCRIQYKIRAVAIEF